VVVIREPTGDGQHYHAACRTTVDGNFMIRFSSHECSTTGKGKQKKKKVFLVGKRDAISYEFFMPGVSIIWPLRGERSKRVQPGR
jgi:hypothetical protein